jgi:hypothetical protein
MYLVVANPQAYRETDDESDPANSLDYLKEGSLKKEEKGRKRQL